MSKLILALAALSLLFIVENTTYFEDASFRTGNITGCLPGGLCSQPDGLYFDDVWADPNDGAERYYVRIPSACDASLNGDIVTITFCP